MRTPRTTENMCFSRAVPWYEQDSGYTLHSTSTAGQVRGGTPKSYEEKVFCYSPTMPLCE